MSSPTSLLTSGYGQTVLLFLFEASVKEGYKPNVVKNLDAGENLSFMVKHPQLQNVFYAAHEMESGAVSRWNLNAQGQFNMLEKVTFSGKHPCHLRCEQKKGSTGHIFSKRIEITPQIQIRKFEGKFT